MKIGIITLSASFNCGSMLQSYALKKILGKYGDVEVINFSSETSHQMYDIIPSTFVQRLKLKIRNKFIIEELENETEAYTKFQNDMLGIKGKEFFAEDLHEIESKYDVVIVGSDQVWNVCMGDFDEAFFCDWTKSKKIAYAPSLGGHDIRESVNSNRYIESIKKFDSISVREEVGKKCLDEILQKNITKVLDPTLVIDVEDWKSLIGKPLVEGEYIFYYSWAYCYEELRQMVSERSKQTNLPVYVIDAHKWRNHSYSKDGFLLCHDAGPLAFLNLMLHARECYVESFHGMIFAYLFKKNFWILDTHENYEELDSRLKELVELVDAKNRLLTKFNFNRMNFNKEVEYSKNEKLDQLREVSNAYIEEALLKKI